MAKSAKKVKAKVWKTESGIEFGINAWVRFEVDNLGGSEPIREPVDGPDDVDLPRVVAETFGKGEIGRVVFAHPNAKALPDWFYVETLSKTESGYRYVSAVPGMITVMEKHGDGFREFWPWRSARYVAVAAGVWGRGHTREEAIANLRGAGWRKPSKAVLYVMPEGAENPSVDSFGAVVWTWAEGADRSKMPERINL